MAQLNHSVGLVDDEDLQLAQLVGNLFIFDEVPKPSWCGNEDERVRLQDPALLLATHPADETADVLISFEKWQ